jgi:hypothetical protein
MGHSNQLFFLAHFVRKWHVPEFVGGEDDEGGPEENPNRLKGREQFC